METLCGGQHGPIVSMQHQQPRYGLLRRCLMYYCGLAGEVGANGFALRAPCRAAAGPHHGTLAPSHAQQALIDFGRVRVLIRVCSRMLGRWRGAAELLYG